MTSTLPQNMTQCETMDLLELIADIEGSIGRSAQVLMLEAMARVGTEHEGIVSTNHIREIVRGQISPERIGPLLAGNTGAKKALVKSGIDYREGSFSRDNGRPQPRRALGSFKNWCAAYAKATNHGDDVEWAKREAIAKGWADTIYKPINGEFDGAVTDWKVYLHTH